MKVDDTKCGAGSGRAKLLCVAFLCGWVSHGELSIQAQEAPHPKIVRGELSSEGFEIVMEGEPRTLYRLEQSSDLWNWTQASGEMSGTNGVAKFVIPSFRMNEADRSFYRVGRQEIQLNDARALWQSSGIMDYRYRIECHAGRVYVKAKVQVENGRVVSIEQVEGFPGLTNEVVKPLPEYFDLIGQSGEVMVDFNPVFGYPAFIGINLSLAPVDGGASYLIRLEEARFGEPINGWTMITEVPFQEERRVDDGRLAIRFNSLEEDSRCPIGVDCVWAGVGVITVRVEETGAEPELLKLATTGQAMTVNHGTYGIKLHALWPYPRFDRIDSAREYVATLLVWRR